MSLEFCQVCNKESTPWKHINGRICAYCAMPRRWISADICHPQFEERVLFYVPKREGCNLCIGYIIHPANRGKDLEGNQYYWFVDESENTGFLIDEVSHWMPLPQPPEDAE